MAELSATVSQIGGDYSTLDACLDGEAQDLTDGAGDTFTIQIINAWTVDDSVRAWNSNWTTDATCFITIVTIGSARHNGTWTSTAHRLRGDGQRMFVGADYTVIDGLQFSNTQTSSTGDVSTIYSAITDLIMKNCIIRKEGTATDNMFGLRTDSNDPCFVYNNLVYDFIGSGANDMGLFIQANNNNGIVSNNTIVNCLYGIYSANQDCIARNNLIYNCTNQTNSVQFANNTGYNSTDDSKFEYTVGVGGGNDRVNQTFTFEAPGSDDYHLQSSDVGAKDYGIDLSGLFTTDIDGDTRSTPWDIGMDDVVSGATAHEKELDDTITITSFISKSVGIKRNESISVSDVPQKLSKKDINMSIIVSDLLRILNSKSLNESINVIDDISNFDVIKKLTDAINVDDNVLKTTIISLLETISVTENFGALIAIQKFLNDTINVSDELGGFNVNKSLTDIINIADGISKVIITSLLETISIAEDFSALTAIQKLLSDTITVSDELGNFNVNKSLTDIINITDNISKTIIMSLLETISVAEEFEKILGAGIIEKLLTDTITVTDELGSFNINKPLIDGINISEILSKHSLIKLIDTISISDEIDYSTILEKILTDVITVTSELGSFNIEKNLSENIVINETIKKYLEILISDNININESFTAIRVIIVGYILLKNISLSHPSVLGDLMVRYDGCLTDITITGGN